MSKITLNPVADLTQSTTAQNTINNDFSTIQTAFDNTLSRDGTMPNMMNSYLDMNSFQILNLPAPGSVNSPARLIDVTSNPSIVVPGTGTSGHAVPFLDGNNTWSGTNTFSAAITANNTATFNGTTNFTGSTSFSSISLPNNSVTYAELASGAQNLNNVRNSKSTNYTVVNADKGTTLALNGNSSFTVTFNTPSGYDANFIIRLLNEDANNAKFITITGGTNFILYPGQNADVFNQNNVWQVRVEGRWRIPGNLTLFVNSAGNDSNDGLTVGNPFLTPQHAWNLAVNKLDLNGFLLTIQLADGTYNLGTTGWQITGTIPGQFFSGGPPYNAQTEGIILQGNITTPTNCIITSADTLGTITVSNTKGVNVQGFQLKNTDPGGGGSCLVAIGGSHVRMKTCDFNTSPNSHISAGGMSKFDIVGAYTISAGAQAHVFSGNIGDIEYFGSGAGLSNFAVTISGTPNFSSGFAIVQGPALMVVKSSDITWSGAATGPRYSAFFNGVLNTAGGGANYFPGNSAGSTGTGGVYF